ncbi:phospholipase, patatin family protein [Rhizodiscina lignyota]|uniref:Phospholipase, patatin family protein n=1 Tax=Rhizodiscina lignyota TaxID=1504668 RepID=A0A9P4M2V7_9PEZI|nr:phospholipase, patatin family protein [Rhizodiscina lignyota]
MERAREATEPNREPNPLDSTGLCLLSLDGGGVRGLSALYILKSIIDRLNHERSKDGRPVVKPCEVFDHIGGTSTGGLIAIMVGRLEMDVDKSPFNNDGKIKARFSSAKLESAVKMVVEKSSSSPPTALLNDDTERGCRTLLHMATSAATTFFNPVSIGDRSFADGGLGANNPVDVEGEASNVWCSQTGDLKELKPLVKCFVFVSIGTRNPAKKAFEDSVTKFLSQTVVQIATESENTEKRFIARSAKHFDEKRYFRFNAQWAVTEAYLVHISQKLRIRDCIQNLVLKQSVYIENFA